MDDIKCAFCEIEFIEQQEFYQTRKLIMGQYGLKIYDIRCVCFPCVKRIVGIDSTDD